MARTAQSETLQLENPFDEINPDPTRKYAYVLAQKNERRGMVYDENGRPRHEIEYKPYLNVILTSSVVWPMGKIDPFSGKVRNGGRHKIRYYDGCTTLFVDDQPKEKATIDQLVASTREVIIRYGHLFIMGYDSLLKIYLDWCSYNEESPYRVPSVEVKFKAVNQERESDIKANVLELEDTARDTAKEASVKKMKTHSRYLGLPFEDGITGQPLSEKAIRTGYREYAKNFPKEFMESFNDSLIEAKTWISDALATGILSTTMVNNTVVWAKTGAEVSSLYGLKSIDLIIDKLAELAQTEEGADFLAQLKALYS